MKPQANQNFTTLLTDNPSKAGVSTGRCSLNAKDTKGPHGPIAWPSVSGLVSVSGVCVWCLV